MCAPSRESSDGAGAFARPAPQSRVERLDKCFGPLIVLAAVLVYGQTFFYEFSYLDDHRLVVHNREFLGDIRNVGRVWTEDAFRVDPTSDAYYRPIFVLSFMLDVLAGGGRPQVCHATNVALHALACWLLYRVLLCLGCAPVVSVAIALLFGVHPVNVQAVAWIPGRNDILLSVFAMGAVLTLRLQMVSSGGLASYVVHILCVASALFSKESAPMMLPFFALLALHWARQEEDTRGEPSGKRSGLAALRQVPFLEWSICLLVWFALRYAALGSPGIATRSSWATVVEGLAGAIVFFGKTVLPVDLAILPALDRIHFAYGCLALLLCLAVVGMRAIRSRRAPVAMLAGLGWGFAFLLPPLLLAPAMSPDVRFMEHRLYVPLIGFSVFWAHSALLPPSRDRWHRAATAHWVAYAGLVVCFAMTTMGNSTGFRDRRVVAATMVRQSPNSLLAHTNMGVIDQLDGNVEDARTHYLIARDLDTNHPLPHLNLGVLAIEESHPRDALPHLERAVELAPTWHVSHESLAAALRAVGRTNEAARAAATARELRSTGLRVQPEAR